MDMKKCKTLIIIMWDAFRKISPYSVAIFSLGLTLAALYSWTFPIYFFGDSILYVLQALNFGNHPESLLVYPVLSRRYSYFGMIGQMVFGNPVIPVVLLQHLLLVISATMMFHYGKTLYGRKLGILWAAAILLNGPLLFYAHTYMTESLNVSFTIMALVLIGLQIKSKGFQWRNSLATGFFLGLAFLARPTGLLTPIFYTLAIFLVPVELSFRTKSKMAGAILIGFSLVLVPVLLQSRLAPERGPHSISTKSLYLSSRIFDFHLEDDTLPATREIIASLGEEAWERLKTATRGFYYDDPIGSQAYQAKFTKTRGRAVIAELEKKYSPPELEGLLKRLTKETFSRHPFQYAQSVLFSFLEMTGLNGILGISPLPSRAWYAWDWGEEWGVDDIAHSLIARPRELKHLVIQSRQPAGQYAFEDAQAYAKKFQGFFYRWFQYNLPLGNPLGKTFYEFSRIFYPLPWLWAVLSVAGIGTMIKQRRWDILIVLAVPFINNLLPPCFLSMPADRATIPVQPFWTFLAFYPIGILLWKRSHTKYER